MLKYVIKRIILVFPILLGVVFMVYFIMDFTPGDPALRKLGNDAPPEAIEQLREEMGLNRSFPERFVTYIWDIVTKFDFGESWRTGKPVFDEILPRIPVTFKLNLISLCVATAIGIPLGVFSAVKQNSVGDNIMRVLATVMVAMPGFWMAMLLILLFALRLSLLPPSGFESWKHLVLPVVCIAGPLGCRILRMTRSSMLESIREDFVRTARAKGVPQRKVTYQHALKNALLPVVTTVGSTLGGALGGSIILENVFAIPGLGTLVVLSIRSKDIPMMLACVLVSASFVAIVMVLVDVVYALVDPRIKAKYAKKK